MIDDMTISLSEVTNSVHHRDTETRRRKKKKIVNNYDIFTSFSFFFSVPLCLCGERLHHPINIS